MVLAAAGFAVLVAGLYALTAHAYTFRLEVDRLRVVSFRVITVFSVRYEAVTAVREVALGEVFNLSVRVRRLGNRLSRSCVLIEYRGRFFRGVVLTPSDAAAFVATLRAKLPRSAAAADPSP